MDEDAVAAQIVDASIAVHRALGPGLLESAYGAAMAIEMVERGLKFEQEVAVQARYHDRPLGIASSVATSPARTGRGDSRARRAPLRRDPVVPRATKLSEWFRGFAKGELDLDKIIERRGADGNVQHLPMGILIAQFLHHGNEHRAQLGSIFGANGIEPPHYSAFHWGTELGKIS